MATVIAIVTDGMSSDEIVHDLLYLEHADIDAALRFTEQTPVK